MNRRLFTTLAAAAATLALMAPTGALAQGKDIRVAMGGPVSGGSAAFGQQMRRGVSMAIEDLNAKGGVLGRKLVYTEGDDASNPSQGRSVANKFASEDVVFVVGHFNSSVSIPASEVYADEGILQISPASTNPQLTERGLTTVFRTCGRDDQQGQVAADYMVKNHKNGRIALVHDQTTYGQGLADATKAAMNKAGLKEAMYEAVAVGERDMSALITRMRNAGIDVVYFGGLYTEAGLMVRQMADQGLKAQFISGDGVVNQEFWNIAGPAGEGALVTFGRDFRERPEAADVVKRFRAQGFEPESYTLYSYAAVQAWAQAVEKAKTTDAEKVAAALRDGSYSTVLGNLSFDAKGDRKETDYVFYRWSNGNYKEIGG